MARSCRFGRNRWTASATPAATAGASTATAGRRLPAGGTTGVGRGSTGGAAIRGRSTAFEDKVPISSHLECGEDRRFDFSFRETMPKKKIPKRRYVAALQ